MNISVCLATYNGERYLREQLKSLAIQSHRPFELQVGDDGSSDATIRILEEFASDAPFPVTIVRNTEQLGYGDNFLRTAQRCSGDWIAFCDQDDVWHSDKLAICAQIIGSHDSQLRLIVHNATVTDAELTPLGPLDAGPFGVFSPRSLPPTYLAHGFRMTFQRLPMLSLSMTDRRLDWLGHPAAHDNWICVIASLTGTVVSIADTLVDYRRHDYTTTRIPSRNLLADGKRVLQNNAMVYDSESKSYARFAEYLSRNLGRNDCGRFDIDLVVAISVVSQYSEMLSKRASIYLRGNKLGRLHTFWELLISGAYSVRAGWTLSVRSAFKDLSFCLFGRA